MTAPPRYTVSLKRRAEQALQRLPKTVRIRVDVLLMQLADNPRPPGVAKLSGQAGSHWRIRIRDYRILYQIDDQRHLVEVYRIKHRSQVYR